MCPSALLGPLASLTIGGLKLRMLVPLLVHTQSQEKQFARQEC